MEDTKHNQDPQPGSTAKGHRVEFESLGLSSIKRLPVTQDSGGLEARPPKSRSENLLLRRRNPQFEDNPNAVSISDRSQLPKEDEEREHKNIKTVKVIGTQCMPSDLGNIEDFSDDNEDRVIELGLCPMNDPQACTTGGAQKCTKTDHIKSKDVDNLVQVPAKMENVHADKEDKRMGHQKNNFRRIMVITLVIVALIMMVSITPHYFSSASNVDLSAKDFHIGDLLVISRFGGFYEHYAIIASNTSLVHLTGGRNDWTRFRKGTVKEEELDVSNFMKDKNARIESGTWKGREPLLAQEILKRARSQIGKQSYNLIFNNCEHFARWCRYGVKESPQANWLLLILLVGVCLSALLLVVWLTTG